MNCPKYKNIKSVSLKEIFLSVNKKKNVTTLPILFTTFTACAAVNTATFYMGSSQPTEIQRYSMALLFLYFVFPGLALGLFLSATYISNKPLRKAVFNELSNIFAHIKELWWKVSVLKYFEIMQQLLILFSFSHTIYLSLSHTLLE